MNNNQIKEAIITVLSEHKRDGLHVSEITDRIIAANNSNDIPDRKKMQDKVNAILNSDANKKANQTFQKVKNSNTGKDKKGVYKLKTIKPDRKIPPVDPPEIQPEQDHNPITPQINPNTLFIGKAGECAVMSELLFRGYNANLMMVDDGVDIVASKNNMYYFIQVKTTTLDNTGRISSNIKKDRFDAFMNTQIRYIIVARCKIADLDTNLYFVFDNNKIDEFIFDKLVNKTQTSISIKIKLDKENGNRPILFNGNQEKDISFFMNRFI